MVTKYCIPDEFVDRNITVTVISIHIFLAFSEKKDKIIYRNGFSFDQLRLTIL